MSHDLGYTCVCTVDHRPPTLELNAHHIQPLHLGGPDVPENRVWLCPTTHANTHELLRLLIKADGAMTYRRAQEMQERPVNRYAYDLAVEGFRRWLTS